MDDSLALTLVKWAPLVSAAAGGIFISLMVDYVTPGRKGKLRTERDHFFEGRTVQEIRAEMIRRLEAERFKMVDSGVPNKIVGTRRAERPKDSVMKGYAFKKLKLDAEVEFHEREGGVLAKMAIATPETITRDTGEGEYFEVMLDYLNMSRSLRPMSPVPNIFATLAMYASIVLAVLPIMFLIGGMPAEHAKEFLIGLGITSAAEISLAIAGIFQISTGKGIYTGYKQAIIAIALCIFAFLFGVGMYMVTT